MNIHIRRVRMERTKSDIPPTGRTNGCKSRLSQRGRSKGKSTERRGHVEAALQSPHPLLLPVPEGVRARVLREEAATSEEL